jgi:hypothetical protein
MSNVIRFPSHRIAPVRRVLFPSVVPFELNRSTRDADMAYHLMSLGLIVTTAFMSICLAHWLDRICERR